MLMRSLVIFCLLVLQPAMAGRQGGSRVSLLDSTNYTAGAYLAFLAPYGKGSYISGSDFAESATILASTFPNNTVISWRWPNTPPVGSGVYNLLAVDFGNYDNTTVQTPITPKQVNSISTLTQTHSISVSGSLPSFDVIDDLFLTSTSNGTTLLFEVEIFLHTPAYAATFVSGGFSIGTFIGSGITWTVVQTFGGAAGNDILFMPTNQADVLLGVIDIKAMLAYLVSRSVITGSEWFNGLALGAETQQGVGGLTIHTMSEVYN